MQNTTRQTKSARGIELLSGEVGKNYRELELYRSLLLRRAEYWRLTAQKINCRQPQGRATGGCRFCRSLLYGNDMRLYLALHRPGPELPGNSVLHEIGHHAEARSVARLDLATQRRALAIRDRRDAGGCRLAARGDRIELGWRSKPAKFQILRNGRELMVTMRRAGHEARRGRTEKRCQRLGRRVREFVFLDPVPDIEHEHAARP